VHFTSVIFGGACVGCIQICSTWTKHDSDLKHDDLTRDGGDLDLWTRTVRGVKGPAGS
jgi:hypothetical protein